ncbi:MAG: tRNA1(Val) (adenine(37)-N6)-methyltransferase [Lachnospiraceae bacterium]|nr:tRNA1(Val) (adenine(37)-N6)-methyltransferase [Lachnospiraceae bacterium]
MGENNIVLKEDERIDDLQRCGLKIIQNTKKFCFGMDAVLLASFAKAKKGEVVLDLGTGTGIIPIIMQAKTEGSHFTGIDIQEESVEMANRSIIMNNQQGLVEVRHMDIKEVAKEFKAASFDVVTSNPPYMTQSHGLLNPDMPKAIARHEIMCDLEDVVSAADYVLRPNGRFYMVHRPFRLIEIITTLTQHKLEPKRIKFVYPYVDKEPNMVLIEAIKGAKRRVTVEEPLIVYREPGEYTKDIYEIYGY